MKYIIVKSKGQETMLIFSEITDHVSVAKPYNTVISAGFLNVGLNKDFELSVSCFGKSLSLSVESRPDKDTELAEQTMKIGKYKYC